MNTFRNIQVSYKKNLEIIFISLFAFLYSIAAIAVSLNRYWQFDSFWYDFGIFDQTIWSLSRFKLPIIAQLAPPMGKLVWADHFNPSAIFLAPLYWLTDKAEIILVAQVIFVVLSSLVFYVISRKIIKNNLVRITLFVSYLGFVGLQNALYTDVHNIVFSLLPFSLAIWSIYAKKWKIYLLFLFLTLGFQENLGGLGIGLGLFLFLKDKKNLKIALFTIIVSLGWSILTTKWIMPVLSGGPYNYQPVIPENLTDWFTSFIFPANLKLKAIIVTYLSFGLLPIFSISTLPLIIEHYLERFVLNVAGTRWDLGLHYNALLSPIMALASIEAILKLQKIRRLNKILGLWAISSILVIIFIHRFYYHGPLMLATIPDFYKHTADFEFLRKFEKEVPKKGLLMTQNNLASHFTHSNVMLLDKDIENIKPETVAFDVRKGQNANDFFPLSEDDTHLLISQLSTNPNYEKRLITKDQILFVKIN